ncbi:MAG: hypothetical protein P8176_14645 [Gammaproteobacteria bacterium]
MKGSQAIHSGISRAEAIDLLWKLKHLSDNKLSLEVPHVHFNMLLVDPAYRAEIIAMALNANCKRVRELAQRIHDANLEGQLISNHAQSNVRVLPKKALTPPAPSPRLPQREVAETASMTGDRRRDLAVKEHIVKQDIVSNEKWQAGQVYVLEGIIYVSEGAVLSIDAGVTIKGTPGSALVVTRGSQLLARGTKSKPIVFTSSAEKRLRQPGDWGGVVLLGNASMNEISAQIEGIDPSEVRGQYGGNVENSSCGVLEYVRIEYAGFALHANNELNGLTLGACGTNTVIHNVQVHKAMDDGIELFGGGVDLKNIVITGAGDDGLDWDKGCHGRVQFMVVQQDVDRGDNAIEGDSHDNDLASYPRSEPTLANLTLVGGFSKDKAQRGIVLRRGTGGHFENVLLTGFSAEAIDIRGAESAQNARRGVLTFKALMIFNTGKDGNMFFQDERNTDDDKGFDEKAYFSNTERVRLGLNPGLSARMLAKHNFSPRHLDLLQREVASKPVQGEFWDDGAQYIGAVPAQAKRTWLAGWTRFTD